MEGTRVHVFSPNRIEYLGEGTIEKVEELHMEDSDIVISDYPSRIALDSGEVTEGIKCWWMEIT